MRVLVAYGTRMGGTEGLAQAVARGLASEGHAVDVRRARDVRDLASWDAVVVGGALYMFRWHAEARRFVRRHTDALREMPAWFFSSGPLDDSASRDVIPPVRQVRRLMDRVGASGHATFGGRIRPDEEHFLARGMVNAGQVGDFRDMDRAHAWGAAVGRSLARLGEAPAREAASAPVRQAAHGLLAALLAFIGVTAMWGGVELMLGREGASWVPPLALLEGTPFSSYFVPGLLLFNLVGVLSVSAALLVLRRVRHAEVLAFAAGCSITIWITTQLAMLGAFSFLHALYIVAGVATCALAWSSARTLPRLARVFLHAAPFTKGSPS